MQLLDATSACCDGVLLEYCLSFILGGTDKVVTYVKMDNAAGRSFFLRSGVGQIPHISLRVLWMQQRVKEKALTPSTVPSRQNPADLGDETVCERPYGVSHVFVQSLQLGYF